MVSIFNHMLNRTPQRTLAVSFASALCLIALAGCSTPFTNQALHTDDNDNTAGGTDNIATDANAKKFVSCLTGKGFEAQAAVAPRTSDSSGKAKTPTTKNMVMLRMLDANGQPVEAGDNGMSVSTDSTTQQMYANSMFTSIDYGTVWVAFKDSTALAGSPYESKRQDYADCEAKNPNFSQPAQNLSQTPTYTDADKQAALDFAKKAREKGFSWVADPTGDEPTTILIPKTVNEDELRRFFKECPVGDAHITYGFDGTAEDFGYDYTKVMDEAMGVVSY
ncbi:hypothetical protein JS530_07375 [Bifidobacterium sp. LC6]|uniref:Uridine kinase n=1 Tax=Bifidobacterium colobi TaxID=2809026 RepID=A0ABS5UW41_9BIFI|nr:hypothetical protein [Bifidobacterium colobi]MBT1175320.1 hypothetical protein [Bifidobacterium colobi]